MSGAATVQARLGARGPAFDIQAVCSGFIYALAVADNFIKAGQVKPGDVVVLRGLGVIGGPGMALTSAVIFALDGAKLLDRVAAITEGQLSGLVNNGLVVGEASPEAAAGGPLSLVENGDIISIDVRRKVVDLEVPENVLAERRKSPKSFGAQNQRGWLGVYQRTVAPVHEGAVLNKGAD